MSLTSINLSIKMNFWEWRESNPGGWVRNKNVTSELFSPLANQKFLQLEVACNVARVCFTLD